MRESLADGIRRRREALHQVRKFFLGQIQFDSRLGAKDKGTEKQCDKGWDKRFHVAKIHKREKKTSCRGINKNGFRS
jgi:hypothetical protein